MEKFAERYKELKQERSLTYPKVAECLGLKTRVVQRYAAGAAKPDFYGLLALADLFDVSLDYLVGRSDDPARR